MSAVQRSRLAWLVCLALTAFGGLLVHNLAYSLVGPTRAAHPHGHGDGVPVYATHWRVCVVICVLVVVMAGAGAFTKRVTTARAPRLPLWVFALVPLLGFILQEQVERSLHMEALSTAGALEPTFLVGIVLQLPFALAALLSARALIGLARAFARTLASPRTPELVSAELTGPPASDGHRPRLSVLALGRPERGPPLAATR